MKAEIRVTRNFKKQAKPLLKKYPSLIAELSQLEKDLTANPRLGKALGNDAYKIRIAKKVKAKEKAAEQEL